MNIIITCDLISIAALLRYKVLINERTQRCIYFHEISDEMDDLAINTPSGSQTWSYTWKMLKKKKKIEMASIPDCLAWTATAVLEGTRYDHTCLPGNCESRCFSVLLSCENGDAQIVTLVQWLTAQLGTTVVSCNGLWVVQWQERQAANKGMRYWIVAKEWLIIGLHSGSQVLCYLKQENAAQTIATVSKYNTGSTGVWNTCK